MSTSTRLRPPRRGPDMWAHLVEGEARDGFGFMLKGRVNDIGYQSVCVPAALRAFEEIHRPSARCPGRRSAGRRSNGRGWLAGAAGGRALLAGRRRDGPHAQSGAPALQPSRASSLLPPPRARRAGSARLVTNPDYAATLALIAEKGAAVFYEGEIAER